ncbi:hypothetical protein [Bradyrhizobium sp. NC92]|uniref:hypothetical protein n=1 Tax=Bradyrhizobium sp. (strain NC92) TaxID=55395 RepID=UPI0021AA9825|nr:hypothetical protein [Bradyrhizobium sp. NC92]UWU67767.1 hypothetical protein N2602_31820 [Bradyrhizobium sp. NC92]
MNGRGDTKDSKDTPAIEADDAVDQRLGETVRLLSAPASRSRTSPTRLACPPA